MYCSKCGKFIKEESNFCNYCGEKISVLTEQSKRTNENIMNFKDVNEELEFDSLRVETIYKKSDYKLMRKIIVTIILILGILFFALFNSSKFKLIGTWKTLNGGEITFKWDNIIWVTNEISTYTISGNHIVVDNKLAIQFRVENDKLFLHIEDNIIEYHKVE